VLVRAVKAVLLSVVLSVLASMALNYAGMFYSPNWWCSLLLFCVLFIALYFIFNYRTSPRAGTELVIGANFAKLLVLFFSVFIYSLVDKKGLFSFSVHFISHYILFTVFEIRYLLSVIKTNK
jgi:hypothetical protein